MTTPIVAQYQGPQHHIKGLVRDRLMAADSPNRCHSNPEPFERVIELTVEPTQAGRRSSSWARKLIGEAKAVCAECPVRLQCLAVHGPDLKLGVVGGLTDAERAVLFGGETA
jgi:hypothetical protein